MVDDLEMSIRMKAAKDQIAMSKKIRSNDPVMMGGQEINEEELMNENLC